MQSVESGTWRAFSQYLSVHGVEVKTADGKATNGAINDMIWESSSQDQFTLCREVPKSPTITGFEITLQLSDSSVVVLTRIHLREPGNILPEKYVAYGRDGQRNIPDIARVTLSAMGTLRIVSGTGITRIFTLSLNDGGLGIVLNDKPSRPKEIY